jgi:hypothetical protein
MGRTVAQVLGHAATSDGARATATAAAAPWPVWLGLVVALALLLVLVRRPGVLAGLRRMAQGGGAAAAGGAALLSLRGGGTAPLQVAGRLTLGPGRQLLLVEAAGRRLLVGVGPEVQLLADWPAGGEDSAVPEGPGLAAVVGGPAADPFASVLEAHLERVRRAGRLPFGRPVRGRRHG